MIVPERTLPRVGQVTLALGTEFQVPLRADGETGLHDFTSLPAFLEPTSLRGPGAPLLSHRSCGAISHHGRTPGWGFAVESARNCRPAGNVWDLEQRPCVNHP